MLKVQRIPVDIKFSVAFFTSLVHGLADLVSLQVTANALRQQVMNREARRLEKEIKEVRQ